MLSPYRKHRRPAGQYTCCASTPHATHKTATCNLANAHPQVTMRAWAGWGKNVSDAALWVELALAAAATGCLAFAAISVSVSHQPAQS